MASLQSRLFKFILRRRKKPTWDFNTSVTAFREQCEAGPAKFGKMPPGMNVIPVIIDGLRAEWLLPTGTTMDKVILWSHGGGYISGSCSDHRIHVAKFVQGSGIGALQYEYRLAPEYPFPAALEDTLTVYNWLLTQGVLPANIVFAGDSAGGGLCLATLLALKEQGLPLPAAAIALSPWTDLKCTGESYHINADKCMSPYNMWNVCSKYYAGDNDPGLPLISPLYGDLSGLPPLLIYASDDEILRDDSIKFAEKAKAAGVEVKLHIEEGMIHCYPALPAFIPEARRAREEICEFIRWHLVG